MMTEQDWETYLSDEEEFTTRKHGGLWRDQGGPHKRTDRIEPKICPNCGGSGEVGEYVVCPECGGMGEV